jgi:uncharacterized protein (UPF0333 family)
MGTNGQVSMEYMMLLGISLIVVGILWVSSGNSITDTQWDLELSYTKNAIEKIVQTADIMYVQGPPAKAYVNTDLPEGVRQVYISGNSISMELDWKGYPRNITGYSIANLTGSISPARGTHRILVSAGSIVDISEA